MILQEKLLATSSSCAAVAAKQKPVTTGVRHFRDWLHAATTGASQACRLSNLQQNLT